MALFDRTLKTNWQERNEFHVREDSIIIPNDMEKGQKAFYIYEQLLNYT